MNFKINDFVYCVIYRGKIFKITRIDNKSYFRYYIKGINVSYVLRLLNGCSIITGMIKILKREFGHATYAI